MRALSGADAAGPIQQSEIERVLESTPKSLIGGAGVGLVARLLDPGLGLQELQPLVASEPALALRVLQVANSAYYGRTRQVTSLPLAAQLLGLDALRGVAAAVCFDGLAGVRPAMHGADMHRFRRHAMATACAAQHIARQVAPEAADEAFVAGLLHDTGALLQWRLRPKAMRTLLARLPESADRETQERSLLGLTHAECGRVVLQVAGLPSALCEAVGAHADAAGHSMLVRLLGAGEALADEAGSAWISPRPWVVARDAGWDEAIANTRERMPALLQACTPALES